MRNGIINNYAGNTNMKNKKIILVIAFLCTILPIYNVSALYLSDNAYRSAQFDPKDYGVVTFGNYTYVIFAYCYEFPYHDVLSTQKFFSLNISYDDLPAEDGFNLIPFYYDMVLEHHYDRVSLGFYQAYVDILMYNTFTESFNVLTNFYQSGSLFEGQLSWNDQHIILQNSTYNFTKIDNNLYSSTTGFSLSGGFNGIIDGYPFVQLSFVITLYHDYEDEYEPVEISTQLPIYQDNQPDRDEPEGAVVDRFIENASFIIIMYAIPIFLSIKIDKKFLGVGIILCSAIGYIMGLIEILQIIISVLCAIVILSKNKEGML